MLDLKIIFLIYLLISKYYAFDITRGFKLIKNFAAIFNHSILPLVFGNNNQTIQYYVLIETKYRFRTV